MKVKISIDKEKLKEKLGVQDGAEGPPGRDGAPGRDGKDADVTEVVEAAVSAVKPLIPKVEDIENNLPKLGKPIRDSLELLQGDERLDKSAVKGLEDYEEVKKLAKQPKTANGGGGASVVRVWQEIDTADSNSFEKISKNLKAYDGSISWSGGVPVSSTYTTPSGTITKTITWSGGVPTTIVLSGVLPTGIDTTKTITWSGGVPVARAYS